MDRKAVTQRRRAQGCEKSRLSGTQSAPITLPSIGFYSGLCPSTNSLSFVKGGRTEIRFLSHPRPFTKGGGGWGGLRRGKDTTPHDPRTTIFRVALSSTERSTQEAWHPYVFDPFQNCTAHNIPYLSLTSALFPFHRSSDNDYIYTPKGRPILQSRAGDTS